MCIRQVDRGEMPLDRARSKQLDLVASARPTRGLSCASSPYIAPFKQTRRMRTLLMTLALATGLTAMAQQGHTEKTPAEKAERRTERMVQDLGLDAAQREKVATIHLAYAKAMYDLRSVRDEDRRGRADYLESSRDNGLQQVLTADQYAKLQQLREQRKEKNDGEEEMAY